MRLHGEQLAATGASRPPVQALLVRSGYASSSAFSGVSFCSQ
jgi:hypothetical protein